MIQSIFGLHILFLVLDWTMLLVPYFFFFNPHMFHFTLFSYYIMTCITWLSHFFVSFLTPHLPKTSLVSNGLLITIRGFMLKGANVTLGFECFCNVLVGLIGYILHHVWLYIALWVTIFYIHFSPFLSFTFYHVQREEKVLLLYAGFLTCRGPTFFVMPSLGDLLLANECHVRTTSKGVLCQGRGGNFIFSKLISF